VASYGGFLKTYVVQVIPEDLIKYGLSLSQVIDALSKSNINVGGRVVELGDQYYMVRGLGLIKSLEDIENNVIAYKGGKPIMIKNIARVSLGNIPRTGIVIYNNNDDVVMGNVILRRGEKSIPSIRSINQKIADLNSRILPKGIKVVPYYERWELITTVIKRVLESASIGAVPLASAVGTYSSFCQSHVDLEWLLCRNEDEWCKKLEILVNEPERRSLLVNLIMEKVRAEWLVQNNVTKWMELVEGL
jgi:cobalt-zinc-cadmium resistance protein CzcA